MGIISNKNARIMEKNFYDKYYKCDSNDPKTIQRAIRNGGNEETDDSFDTNAEYDKFCADSLIKRTKALAEGREACAKVYNAEAEVLKKLFDNSGIKTVNSEM